MRRGVGIVGVGAAVLMALPPSAGAATAIEPYADGLGGYETVALLSVGDVVPEASGAGDYQMVGIPDGLGAHDNGDGTYTVYVNHELTQPTESTPLVGAPANRGAFASRFVVDAEGNVLSGERAYDTVYQDNRKLGPAAEVGNATAGFSRFCSATLAGRAEGFDTTLFFTNEEDASAATFDGKGGQTVVIVNNAAYALSRLGHFAKENDVPQPRDDKRTVVFSLEDGPSTPDSQLYLYVGSKRPGGNVLSRNGLNNGQLYVFVADDPAIATEADFTGGSVPGHWVRVDRAAQLDAAQLETAADALGALGFVRIEDGAFSKVSRDDFYFVTTGSSFTAPGATSPANLLGRAYHVRLDPSDPLGPATLDVVYNAEEVIAAGGDIAISPDNVDTSESSLMINEDGTSESRAVMASLGRDGQIWRIPLAGGVTPDVASASPVGTLSPPGRDGVPVGPGIWETSGIIDASFLGTDVWLFDVQAHSPTAAPAAGTVEDGQLLLLRPAGV